MSAGFDAGEQLPGGGKLRHDRLLGSVEGEALDGSLLLD
jgi:hypothetical protein